MPSAILMTGPALSVRGGMSSVVRLILTSPPDGVDIRYVETFVDGPPWRRVATFLGAIVRLLSALPGRRYALMHVHLSQRASVLRALILLRLGSLFGTPVVLHAHASEFKEFFESQPRRVRTMIARGLGRCDRFVCLSESWADYYRQILAIEPERVVVLANPVVVPPHPSSGSNDPVTLAFLGRVGDRKGAFDLIEAVHRLPSDLAATLRLTMAGDGELDRARRQIAEAGLSDTIAVHAWITPEERDALLDRTDIYVLPSYHEGLPMSVLEAMAWGIAVIATPVGGIPEWIDDGRDGLLVPPGDIDALAAALTRLARDHDLRRALGRTARERIRPLAVDAYASRLGDLYRRTAEERGAS